MLNSKSQILFFIISNKNLEDFRENPLVPKYENVIWSRCTVKSSRVLAQWVRPKSL